MTDNHEYVLRLEDLRTYFYTDAGEVRAVDGVTLAVRRGRTLALVGESGCGKSVTAFSVLRLIDKPGRIVSGRILLYPQCGGPIDVTALPAKSHTLYRLRGGLVSMIFQEPMTALSPVHTIGNQICEAILLHQDVSKERAAVKAVEMLGRVGIPGPPSRLNQYPHEMSGGMRQRVMIAMALVCSPQLLIADEPTTALDVTIQAQIIVLLKTLQKTMGISILLITHDLAVVAQTADEVAVMYLGRIVEQAPVRRLIKHPRHPYTMALLRSLPNVTQPGRRLVSIAGSVPSLHEMPRGCPFHPRCAYAQPGRCDVGAPPALRRLGTEQVVACLRAEEIQGNSQP